LTFFLLPWQHKGPAILATHSFLHKSLSRERTLDERPRSHSKMPKIRKLAFLVVGVFFIVLFIFRQSPSSPSILRKSPHRIPAQKDGNKQSTSSSPAGGKSKEEINRILEQANRPLRQSDEFPSLRKHLEYLFPYDGASATKFPAYIWQTWKYTPAMGEFDEQFRITEASWTEKHHDYVHEVPHVKRDKVDWLGVDR